MSKHPSQEVVLGSVGRGKGGGEARRNTEWQASSGRVQDLTRRSHPKGSADLFNTCRWLKSFFLPAKIENEVQQKLIKLIGGLRTTGGCKTKSRLIIMS